MGYVVAVSYPGYMKVVESAPLFLDGHEISKNLAGMIAVRQPVNDGYGRVPRKFLDILVSKGAYDDGVHVA